jgi:hypothetical protein
MAKPYSTDLRERVVAAVEKAGMSRRQAALHFDVGISTVGPALPGNRQRSAWQNGWAQAEGNWRRASCLSAGSDQGERLYLARARGRTRRARPQGRLPDSVEFCPRREVELQKKPWSPANGTVPTSREGGRSGQSIRAGSNLSAWSSSMRPGPRPTWRRSRDGHREVRGW